MTIWWWYVKLETVGIGTINQALNIVNVVKSKNVTYPTNTIIFFSLLTLKTTDKQIYIPLSYSKQNKG